MTLQARAFEFVTDYPGCQRRDVQRGLSVSFNAAHRVLCTLKRKGLVEWTGPHLRAARWNAVPGAVAPEDMRGRTPGSLASLLACSRAPRKPLTQSRGRRIFAYAWGLSG